MTIRMRVADGGDLRRLSRDLRKLSDGKELAKAFRKEVRVEAKKIQAEVRAGYKSAPGWSGPRRRSGGSLRSMLARATTIQVRTSRRPSVSIGVRGSKMPDGMKAIPTYYEGIKPWRHPVYGNRGTWVSQPGTPVFTRIVPKSRRRVQRAVGRIADDYAKRIARDD